MQQNEREAVEAQQKVSQMVNGYGFDIETFANNVMIDHRTLQQNTFRLFITCIKKWSEAYDAGLYDQRNEQTCKTCHEIMEKYPDGIYLPFI